MLGSRASADSGVQSEIARLRVKHNHLHGHWSSGTKAGMSYKQSDAAYKLHLGRIMELYLKDRRGPQEYRERQAMDNGQSLRETPLTLLYGVHGLAVDTKNLARLQRRREEKFDNRVYTLQRLEREVKIQQQHAERASQREEHIADHAERQALRTASSSVGRPSTFLPSPSPSRGRFESGGMEGTGSLGSLDVDRSQSPQFMGAGSSHARTPRSSRRSLYRRCSDPAVPRDEVTLRGMYRLNDDQMRVYEDFVHMLSHFDHFDSVSILADALTDAVAEAGLADFGGTTQIQTHTLSAGTQRSVSPVPRSKEGKGTTSFSPIRTASSGIS